jgi:hypothetical protein
MLLAVSSGLGCANSGYTIEGNVSVPTDVQRAFSASAPGFVMVQDKIIGVLCAPKTEAVSFRLKAFQDYVRCENESAKEEDRHSGTAYAFRPSSDELEQLEDHSRDILTCGESAPVEDAKVVKDVFGYFYYHSVEPERQVAVGSSKGECISSSRYVVNITLALK